MAWTAAHRKQVEINVATCRQRLLPLPHHVQGKHTHTVYLLTSTFLEFMLNMHILIALSEIISQCIFLSLSSIHELNKQRHAAGAGLHPLPPLQPN